MNWVLLVSGDFIITWMLVPTVPRWVGRRVACWNLMCFFIKKFNILLCSVSLVLTSDHKRDRSWEKVLRSLKGAIRLMCCLWISLWKQVNQCRKPTQYTLGAFWQTLLKALSKMSSGCLGALESNFFFFLFWNLIWEKALIFFFFSFSILQKTIRFWSPMIEGNNFIQTWCQGGLL